jgi:hypothetical protein
MNKHWHWKFCENGNYVFGVKHSTDNAISGNGKVRNPTVLSTASILICPIDTMDGEVKSCVDIHASSSV